MESHVTESNPPHWVRTVLIGRNPKRTLVRIVIFVSVVFLTRAYVIAPIIAKGVSMLPTYQDRSVVFVNRLAYLRSDPGRGDVVAIRFAGEKIMLMKRIVGLPGETVAFRNGRVLINGEPLDEPYLTLPCDWDREPVNVRANEYFVVGDNRSMPKEDHQFGRADRNRIVGKIIPWRNLFGSQ